MVDRFLITTALEETWPSVDTPVVFLGEWCKLYSRKHVWEKYDSITLPYHWDDRDKLFKDYLYLMDLYEIVLKELANKLNEIHGVDHSLRYWRILIGPWLGYFIQILYDRFEMINNVVRNSENLKYYKYEFDKSEIIPNDMTQFVSFFIDDIWNQNIYQSIITFYKIESTSKKKLPEILKDKLKKYPKEKSIVEKLLSWQSKLFVTNSEAFILSSYLPLYHEIVLQISLGQIPRLRYSDSLPNFVYNESIRLFSIDIKASNSFEELLIKIIPSQLPKVYFEGYKNLNVFISKNKWPTNPKFILTSNSHNSDDLFKYYAAEKIENKTKYFIGQHGGHYGIGKWSFMEQHEIESSDKYLTWGWNDSTSSKLTPCYSFKIIKNRNYKFIEKKLLLLVTMNLPRYSYWMYSIPIANQINEYYKDQFLFVKNLCLDLKRNILVRLPSSDYGCDQKKQWHDIYPEIITDNGQKNMEDLIKSCKIYISTYNATTYLESMCKDVPTIMYWNQAHWEIRDSAVPYFKELKRVGIFHESPESAANKVNEIWGDVNAWWKSKEVQEVRLDFCNRYAKKVKKPITFLKNILLS